MTAKIVLLVSIFLYPLCSNNDRHGMTSKEFERAKTIYTSNCMSCHGESGYGDGIASSSFNPPPRNFHLPTEKWVNGKTEKGVVRTLTEGIQPNMWAYVGNESDRRLLAKYVLYLGTLKENK